MVRARSMQEYQDLIKQALFEVEDLRASLDFDEEFMGDAVVFLDPLETSIRELHHSITEGEYVSNPVDPNQRNPHSRVGKRLSRTRAPRA